MTTVEDIAVQSTEPTPGLTARRHGRVAEKLFPLGAFLCVVAGAVVLVTLLLQVVINGWSRLDLNLLRWMPSSIAEEAGFQSALFGTIWIVGLTGLMCIPIGLATAVYLEEFADRKKWYNRLVELNIQNLAAVPSIVYGILGLGFLVRGLDLGATVLAAAMTLTLLVLPIVIIASREAIRAVPSSLRDASLGLGATELQTISRIVLPSAVPGIATGVILALSRAIGEAAPLLIVGGVTFIAFNPQDEGLDGVLGSRFAILPLQIFNWIQRPQEEYRTLAAAAIVALVILLLLMNSIAVWIRNKYEQKW